jgi:hypothetical protein
MAKTLFAVSAAALMVSFIAGWAVTDTQARTPAPTGPDRYFPHDDERAATADRAHRRFFVCLLTRPGRIGHVSGNLLPAVGIDGAGDKGSDGHQLQLAVCTDHLANRQGILVFSRCSDPLPPRSAQTLRAPWPAAAGRGFSCKRALPPAPGYGGAGRLGPIWRRRPASICRHAWMRTPDEPERPS